MQMLWPWLYPFLCLPGVGGEIVCWQNFRVQYGQCGDRVSSRYPNDGINRPAQNGARISFVGIHPWLLRLQADGGIN